MPTQTRPWRCILNPELKRVLTALILIPIALVLVFLGPRWQWLFTLAVGGGSGDGCMGISRPGREGGANPPRIAVLVAVLALFAGNYEWPDQTAAILGVLSLGLLVLLHFFPARSAGDRRRLVSIFGCCTSDSRLDFPACAA